jgi:hypothetical protein
MKKTINTSPITFFRKANEARQKVVKTSLKKAQNGLAQKNYDKEILMKQQYEMDKQRANDLRKKEIQKMNDSWRQQITNMENMAKVDALNKAYPTFPAIKQKIGGSVKRKKK